MSIPAEPSLLQNEVQILNPKPHKSVIGPGGDNVLRPDIAALFPSQEPPNTFFERFSNDNKVIGIEVLPELS